MRRFLQQQRRVQVAVSCRRGRVGVLWPRSLRSRDMHMHEPAGGRCGMRVCMSFRERADVFRPRCLRNRQHMPVYARQRVLCFSELQRVCARIQRPELRHRLPNRPPRKSMQRKWVMHQRRLQLLSWLLRQQLRKSDRMRPYLLFGVLRSIVSASVPDGKRNCLRRPWSVRRWRPRQRSLLVRCRLRRRSMLRAVPWRRRVQRQRPVPRVHGSLPVQPLLRRSGLCDLLPTERVGYCVLRPRHLRRWRERHWDVCVFRRIRRIHVLVDMRGGEYVLWPRHMQLRPHLLVRLRCVQRILGRTLVQRV